MNEQEQTKGQITIIAKNIKGTAKGQITEEAQNISNTAGRKYYQSGKNGGIIHSKNHPRKPPLELRVLKVEGPFDKDGKKVEIIERNEWYTYKVTQFNREPQKGELQNLRWGIKYDDGNMKDLKDVSCKGLKEISHMVFDNNNSSKLRMYAFIKAPSDNASIEVSLKILLYLLFYATGKFGDTLYSEGAQSRLQNIKANKLYNETIHKVHCPPYQDISEIIQIVDNYIKKYGGKEKVLVREVGIWSHAGGDGPLGSTTPPQKYPLVEKEPYQMALEGYGSIDFNWDNKAKFVIYGCDSALESPPEDKPDKKDYKNFAKNISLLNNFKNVEVWGQSSKSCPSYVPDYRVTSLARDINKEGGAWFWKSDGYKTYQIAAKMGGGWKDTSFGGPDVFSGKDVKYIKENYDKANPMHCYKNGTKIRTTDQGYFNDHRNPNLEI